jgi:hypothetical protein
LDGAVIHALRSAFAPLRVPPLGFAFMAVLVQSSLAPIGSSSASPTDDTTPPAAVVDLTAEPTSTGAVVRWTAPGDDGNVGRATAYDLHIATFPMDADNFLLAPSIAAPVPAEAGSRDSVVINGLFGGVTYYLVLRTVDEAGNVSELSNLASVDLDERNPPAQITDLSASRTGFRTFRLQWTASGDDGFVGTAKRYVVEQITGGGAPHTLDAPTPSPSGSLESMGVTVREGVTEAFRVTAVDDVGNVSLASNQAEVFLPAIRPARVTDLELVFADDSSLVLRWTATGDDSVEGGASSYELRAADRPLDARGFDAAPWVRIVPSRFQEGEVVLAAFPVPAPGYYWLALRARDPDGRASAVSNVISARAGGSPLTTPLELAPLANPSRLPVALRWKAIPSNATTTQSIRIHDLSGRLLRSLDLGHAFGGVAVWDGKDDDGRRLPAGLYFARLGGDTRHVQTRVVLLP